MVMNINSELTKMKQKLLLKKILFIWFFCAAQVHHTVYRYTWCILNLEQKRNNTEQCQ